MQRVRHANRGRLLLRTPGPVPFWECMCSNVQTNLSLNLSCFRTFEFRTSLGTSPLLIISTKDRILCMLIAPPVSLNDVISGFRSSCSGADSGIFVRGRSTLPKNFDKPKKKKKKKKREGGKGRGLKYLFCVSMVEIYFCHWNSFTENDCIYKKTPVVKSSAKPHPRCLF